MNVSNQSLTSFRIFSKMALIVVVLAMTLLVAFPQKSHAQSFSVVSESMLSQLFSALESLQGMLAQTISATTSCTKSGKVYQHGQSYSQTETRSVGDNDREYTVTYYCNKGSWSLSKPAPLPVAPVTPTVTPTPVVVPSPAPTVVTPTPAVTTPKPSVVTPTPTVTPAVVPTSSVVPKPVTPTVTPIFTPTTVPTVTTPTASPAPVSTKTCLYKSKTYKEGESYTVRSRVNRDSDYVETTNYCVNGIWTTKKPVAPVATSSRPTANTLGTRYPDLKPGDMVIDILDSYEGAAAVSVYTKNNKRTSCKPTDFLPINSVSMSPKGGKQLTSSLQIGRTYGVGGSSCEEVVGYVTTVSPAQINAKWAPGTQTLNYKDFNGKSLSKNFVITTASKFKPSQGNFTGTNITLVSADKQSIAVALDVAATGNVSFWNNTAVSFEVDWGDGKKDTYSNVRLMHAFGPNPYYAIHTYAAAGTYTPKVTVVDPNSTAGALKKFTTAMTSITLPLTISTVSNTTNTQAEGRGGQQDGSSNGGNGGNTNGGSQNGSNNGGGINANGSGLGSGFGTAY